MCVENCKSATIEVRVLTLKVAAYVDSDMADVGFEQSSQHLANRLQTCSLAVCAFLSYCSKPQYSRGR